MVKVEGPIRQNEDWFEQAREKATIIGNIYVNEIKVHVVECASVSGAPANGERWTWDYGKLVATIESLDDDPIAALEAAIKAEEELQGKKIVRCRQRGPCLQHHWWGHA
jgi:hypothetical protein